MSLRFPERRHFKLIRIPTAANPLASRFQEIVEIPQMTEPVERNALDHHIRRLINDFFDSLKSALLIVIPDIDIDVIQSMCHQCRIKRIRQELLFFLYPSI